MVEDEAKYLEVLKKARPDVAVKVRYPRIAGQRPQRKEWRPKQLRANEEANMETSEEADEEAEGMSSADGNMVFVLPLEFHAPKPEESSMAHMDLGLQPVYSRSHQRKGTSI